MHVCLFLILVYILLFCLLLFCFFAISHINHEIESGFIAKEQARLRSHIDIYENIINGTFLLSSPEQGEVVKFQYFSADYIPWFTSFFCGPLRWRANDRHDLAVDCSGACRSGSSISRGRKAPATTEGPFRGNNRLGIPRPTALDFVKEPWSPRPSRWSSITS